MCLGSIVFWIGSVTYRFCVNEDGRSLFVRMSWVFVKVARDLQPIFGAISNEVEAQRIMPQQCSQFEFLDIASLVPNGSMEDERTSTIDDVQDAKAILRLAPIWFTSLGYSIIYAQPSTLFTKQASTLDRQVTSTFRIPAASLQLFIVLSIIVFVPIYDRILVPIARAITKKPRGISKLQRIGIGLFLSLTSIIVAALVEWKRLGVAFEYGLMDKPKAIIPMSVWWLAPQYLISGVADVFTLVGLQEFFYDEVSSELKSIGLALYLSILGIGSFLSSFLVCVIHKGTSGNGEDGWFSDNLNRAHLDYFYWLLAGISAFLLAAYVYFAKTYIYRSSIEIVGGYLS
ncbi:hypothetical protein CDL12_12770 [Handroanthus impetiginosus]|uniref:Proton-dependent oligopeptide transporter family n=1 Tax=Handroanthus impetiginosus TaxID=429701 RepID=A0A2G9HBA8_9LAMI|nr:hypothetical protein CDL12_12770 [Handroanthus impetiginosus]